MFSRNSTLFTIFFLLAFALTACGTGATAPSSIAPATNEPTLEPTPPSPTDTPAPASTSTSTPLPTETIAATAEPSAAFVSFANDILPILESRCVKCHGGEQTKEGLDLKTYESLMAGSQNGPVVTAGSAEDSYLARQIIEGEMPKRGPKLTPNEIQLVIDWINQGAQNN
jgi:mono/diheme cytochrome c family protein